MKRDIVLLQKTNGKREKSLNYKKEAEGSGSKLTARKRRSGNKGDKQKTHRTSPSENEERRRQRIIREKDRSKPRRSGCWNRGGAMRVYKNNSSWLWLARGLTVGLTWSTTEWVASLQLLFLLFLSFFLSLSHTLVIQRFKATSFFVTSSFFYSGLQSSPFALSYTLGEIHTRTQLLRCQKCVLLALYQRNTRITRLLRSQGG